MRENKGGGFTVVSLNEKSTKPLPADEAEETIETSEDSSQNSEVNRPSQCDLLKLRKEAPCLQLPIDAVFSVLSFHSVF